MIDIILGAANIVLGVALVTCISWIKKMNDSLQHVNRDVVELKTDIEWIKNNLEVR